MQSKLLRSFVPQSVQPVKLKERSDGKLPTIRGYGAVFYSSGNDGTEYWLWDTFVERIDPSAFNRAIREDDPVGLLNHDVNQLLGRKSASTMRLSVDSVGLIYEIDPPETQAGRDTVESVRRGDLQGSSFSFVIKSERLERNEDIYISTLLDVQLFDVGPVTFPAYAATTTGIRHLRGIGDERKEEFEARVKRLVQSPKGLTLDQIKTQARVVELGIV